VVTHTEEMSSFFHKIIVQQISNITITYSFIHTGLIGSHKPAPVNLGVSRCSDSLLSDAHISVLAHCLAGRCQRYSNGTSGRPTWSRMFPR